MASVPTPRSASQLLVRLPDNLFDADIGGVAVAALRDVVASSVGGPATGLSEPNPGVQRLLGLPSVMTTPPTITTSAGSATVAGLASGIASSVFTQSSVQATGINTNPPWIYLGGNVVTQSTGGLVGSVVIAFNVTPLGTVSGSNSSLVVEFETDALAFEFMLAPQNAGFYRILVDGQYVSATPTAGPASGSAYLIKVAFASAIPRRIRLELSRELSFGGLRVGPNDTLWRPSMPTGPRVIVMGDSITAGTGATATLSYWGDTMAKLLGWRDVWQSGHAGSGYLAAAGQMRTRVAADVIAFTPDVVLIAGGRNDLAFSQAQITTEAGLLFSQIRAGLPNVKLIAVGLWPPNGSPDSTTLGVNAGIRAAITADTGAHAFLDTIVATSAGANTLGWITGTGVVGTPTGTGNADRYISADGVHPSQAGHDYLGRRVASAIAAVMPL